MQRYAILHYAAIVCCAMQSYAMLRHAWLCRDMLCYDMLCNAMLSYAMLCNSLLAVPSFAMHDLLGGAMLCIAILSFALHCMALHVHALGRKNIPNWGRAGFMLCKGPGAVAGTVPGPSKISKLRPRGPKEQKTHEPGATPIRGILSSEGMHMQRNAMQRKA